jgi:hypothetical protein
MTISVGPVRLASAALLARVGATESARMRQMMRTFYVPVIEKRIP